MGEELVDVNLSRLLAAKREASRKGEDVTLPDYTLPTFDQLTADELQGVYEQIARLRKIGGEVSSDKKAEKKKDAAEALESIKENGGEDSERIAGHSTEGRISGLWRKDVQFSSDGHAVNLQETFYSLITIRNMVRKLDNDWDGDDGVMYRLVYMPIHKANSKKNELAIYTHDKIKEIMEGSPKINLDNVYKTYYTLENGSRIAFTSEQKIIFAANMGNESNTAALFEGYRSKNGKLDDDYYEEGMTQNDADAILKSMTDDELGLVNKIWEINEILWDQLTPVAFKRFGILPEKIQAKPFMINGVEMSGGYARLYYDSKEEKLETDAESKKGSMSVVPSKLGSLESRVGSGGKRVDLRFGGIERAIEDTIHFIAYGNIGDDLQGIITRKEIEEAIKIKHGLGFYKNFRGSIEDLVTNKTADKQTVGDFISYLMSTASAKYLQYSVKNAMQTSGTLPLALNEVGTAQFINASQRFAQADEAERKDMIDYVNNLSPTMAKRSVKYSRTVAQELKDITSESEGRLAWSMFERYGFAPQIMLDAMISYPVWLAKYESEIIRHGDSFRAAIAADTSVAESVSSGEDLHVGRAFYSSANKMLKPLTAFGSWFNSTPLQTAYKAGEGYQTINGINNPKFWYMIGSFYLAANIAAAVSNDFDYDLWSDDNDESERDAFWLWFLKWSSENTVEFGFGLFPIVRDALSSVKGYTLKSPFGDSFGAGMDIYKELTQYSEDKQSATKTAADIADAVTSLVKVPASGTGINVLDWIDAYSEYDEDNRITGPYTLFREIYQAPVSGDDGMK